MPILPGRNPNPVVDMPIVVSQNLKWIILKLFIKKLNMICDHYNKGII